MSSKQSKSFKKNARLVRSVVEPLNGPAAMAALRSSAVAALAGAGLTSVFETLEGRTMMAGQPTAADSSMAYDAAGTLHVAYHDDAAANLKYTSQSASGTWSAPMTVDGSGADTGRMVSLAVDPAGHPGVAYYDAANADLKFAYNDGTGWKTAVVDAKGGVGKNPSLAFDAKGVPTISYYRQDSGDLRLATLKSLKKNKWSISSVAKKGDVGAFSSLAIDPASNRPVVAFTDSAGKISYVAKKAGGFAKPAVIDTLSAPGSNLGVAFGTNGKPIVSYYDASTGDIKLAAAGDAKAKSFASTTIANVPAGSNANPTLIVNPTTGESQVVYFDSENNGVFVAKQSSAGVAAPTEQLKAGGGEGFIAALQPGNNSISFAVVDTTGTGTGAVDIGNAETTPLPPTNVAAAAVGPTSVAVSWDDASSNETGFLVERSVDGTSFVTVAQVAAGVTSVVDNAATEASVLLYRVSAIGSSGDTAVGSTSAGLALAVATTAPIAATGLTVTAASATQVELAWTNRSAAATGYRVERTSPGSGLWQPVDTVGADAASYVDASVEDGSSYTYRVTAYRGDNVSASTDSASAVTPPATPTGLSVAQVSPTQLDVSWQNDSTRVSQFVLERATDDGAFAVVATLDAGTQSFSDASLAEGSTYVYRVKAVGLIASDYSDLANGTTNPNAPTNLVATPASATLVNLTWTDNALTETNYLVQRAAGNGPFLTVATLDQNATGYADAGRTEGVTYRYRVQAVIAGAANSGFSATVTTVTLPSAPSGLAAALTSGGAHVSLAWTDNATGESGYQVQRKPIASGTWTTIASPAANATSYTDTTPAEGASYAYRVRAVNTSGTSPFTLAVVATVVPAAPTALIVSTVSNGELDLTWSDNSTGEVGYAVERSTDGGDTFTLVAPMPADAISYADTGLDAATTYVYRVSAVNGGGSSAATFSVGGTTLCDAPAGLTATSVSASRIDLAWSAAGGAELYLVERSDNGTDWISLDETSNLTYSDAVSEATGHAYRVRAVNDGGSSEASDVATATSRPAAPTGLTTTVASSTQVNLTWVDHSAGETGYEVERSDDAGDTWTSAGTVAADATTFEDAGVSEGSAYVYRVVATGTGGSSVAATGTAVTTRPATPTGLTATSASTSAVHLAWADNAGHEGSYAVERSDDAGGTWTAIGGTLAADATSFDDSTVLTGVTYLYRVTAVQAGTPGATSDAVSGITLAAAPTDVTATAASDTAIDLSWTAGAGSSGYLIERADGDSTTFVTVATLTDPAVTTYTDSQNVGESSSYTYRVSGTNAAGTGPASADVAALSRPTAPTDLVAVGNGPTSVTLTWVSSSAADVYVLRSVNGASMSALATLPAGTTTYTDNAVSGGTTYQYSLYTDAGSTVYNSADPASVMSNPSAEADPATVTTVPDAVGSLAGVSSTATTANLTWTSPTGATSYEVERSTDGVSFGDAVVVSTNAFADLAADEATDYTYRVTPVGVGGSGPAATVAVTTLPAAATALSVTAKDDANVSLAWADNSAGETGYLVERSTDGIAWQTLSLEAAGTTTYVDSTVAEATHYLYRVTSENAAGGGAAATVDAITLPTAATGVTATGVSATKVTVAWTDASAGEIGYAVLRSDDAGGTWTTLDDTLAAGTDSYDDETVVGGTSYQYKVVAIGDGGDSADSNAATVLTAPAAPAGLVAVAAGTTTVDLTWTDVTGNASYRLERQATGGSFTLVSNAITADATSYSDATADEATGYVYRLVAVNATGDSLAADATLVTTLPAAATGVTATGTSATAVTVAWTDVSGGETGYTVLRSDDAGTTWTTLDDTLAAGTDSYDDATAAGGTSYQYKVVAVGVGGDSADSNVASVLTVPAAAGPVTTQLATPTQVNVLWSDVAGNDTFRIERKAAGGSFVMLADTIPANATSYGDSAVAEGTEYVYRVYAVNASGDSAVAESAAVTTPPAAPSTLAAAAVDAANGVAMHVHLTWADNSGGESAVEVQRLNGADWVTIETLAADAVSYDDAAVAFGNTYSYRVRATNAGGESAFATAADATTRPAVVAGVVAAAASQTAVDVSWSPAAGATGYRVLRSDDNGATFAQVGTDLAANVTSYRNAGLTEATAYVYAVEAFNGTGSSDAGTPASVVTSTAAPTSFALASVTTSTVSLTWADNSGGEANYVVYRSTSGGPDVVVAVLNPDVVAWDDTDIAPATTYDYRVAATNGAGETLSANVVTALTLPGVPANVTAAATSASAVTVSWTAVTGATGGYEVYRDANDGNGFVAHQAIAAGTTTYADTGLAEAFGYSYQVLAINATGNGDPSAAASATTLPAAPDSVGSVAVTTTGLSVTWVDHSAGEDGFEIEQSADGGTTWAPAGTAAPLGGTGSGGSTSESSLTEAKGYVYRVRATLGSQASAWSANYSVDTKPVAPANAGIEENGSSYITINWEDSSDGETAYEVEKALHGGAFTNVATVAAGTTQYQVTGLDELTEYDFRVRAVRNAVVSAYSPITTSTTHPIAPTSLNAVATDPTTVDLTWADNSMAEDGYVVERSTDGGQNWSDLYDTQAADVTSYTDASAPESASSVYRVRAYKGGIQSDTTQERAVTTPVAVSTGLVASATSDTTVHVTWSINSTVATAQRLDRSADGGATWGPAADIADGTTTSFDDSGLLENKVYTYRIFTLVGSAESDPSATIGVTTPLSVPTGLAVTSPTATSAHLTWTNASTAGTSVDVERNDGNGWTLLTNVAGPAASYTDNAVSEGGAYDYRVTAKKAGNASAASSPASVTILPAAPTAVNAAVFSASQIDLTWTDHSNHESGFRIERSENGGAYTVIESSTAPNATSYSDATTHEGGTFAYLVYALGTGGNSTTATATAVSAPADPTALAVSAKTATSVSLGWTDNSAGETGYEVQRSADAGSTWSTLTTAAADVTTYTDATAAEAATYTYRVRGVRTGVFSGYSTVTATTPPAAPTTLAATVPAGAPRVNLTWADHSAGETGFEVERSADAGATWTTVTTTAANATAYADTTVSEGLTYSFRVRAVGTGGASTYAASATASTLPGTPTGLAAVAGTGVVNLTWTDNSAHEAGVKVERSVGGTTWTQVADLAADSVAYADSAVTEGVTYQYRVRAYTAAAQGNPSGSATASVPLSAPTGMTAVAASTTRVNLTWVDNSAAESNFKVERSADGGSTWSPLATVAANGTAYADNTATAGTTYVYRVKATKAALSSTYATAAAVTTVPGNPGSLTATAASDTQVSLSWGDAAGETAYTVERSTDGGANWAELTNNVAANTTAYTDSTAVENGTYVYRIKATNAAGASAYVTSSSVTTLPTGPSDLIGEAVAADTVTITWTDHSTAETGFKVERRLANGTWAEIATVGPNVTTYSDSTLDESVAYEYRVRATVGGRNSAYSNTLAESSLPYAPYGLSTVTSTATSVELAWSNDSAAPTMLIERSDDGGDTFDLVGTAGQGSTGYTDTGLTAGTTYVYRVRATNGAGGFSDYTNAVFGVTTA